LQALQPGLTYAPRERRIQYQRENGMKNDPKVIVKLLRAVANGTDAKRHKHDVIFEAAADMIEEYDRNETRMHLSNRSEA
jgi:hypothetical protein